jgi:hypothetical protein
VWYVEGEDDGKYIVARDEEEAYAKAKEDYGDSVQLRQEDDVLDTWFRYVVTHPLRPARRTAAPRPARSAALVETRRRLLRERSEALRQHTPGGTLCFLKHDVRMEGR